jgi:hypothetical protein
MIGSPRHKMTHITYTMLLVTHYTSTAGNKCCLAPEAKRKPRFRKWIQGITSFS